MLDEGTLRERFPEIPWDQPVKIIVYPYGDWWACRVCIALQGVRGTDLITDAVSFATRNRAACLDHIEREHHD